MLWCCFLPFCLDFTSAITCHQPGVASTFFSPLGSFTVYLTVFAFFHKSFWLDFFLFARISFSGTIFVLQRVCSLPVVIPNRNNDKAVPVPIRVDTILTSSNTMIRQALPGTHDILRIMGWDITSVTAIDLLDKLDQTGSINSAAKAVGLSYKSAWQKLERLNSMVPYPLFNKLTGGSGGGGTVLTDEGHQLLDHIQLLEKEFSQFIDLFSGNPEGALATLKTLRRLEMKISARNVWVGLVVEIEQGVVNCVVNIQLKGGDLISSVITDNSVKRLNLSPGKEVLVIVKASSVLPGAEVDTAQISALNIFHGTISNILPGAVNDEVTIDLPGGSIVTSIITSNCVRRLGLNVGDPFAAIIKATDVLLAIA